MVNRNYIKINFNSNLTNYDFQLIYYYDKNRDGYFSGYDIDYIRSSSFNSIDQKWFINQNNTIFSSVPNENNPLVRIGINIISKSINGYITFNNISIYSMDVG